MSKRKHDEMTGGWLATPAYSLLHTGLYSDLIIKCKDKDFKVHRAIVCTQSEPLASFLRHDSLEAKTGIIDLSEDDVTHVEIMINYLYTGELRTKLEESQGISTYERYILSGKTVSHDDFSKLKADRPQDYKHSNYRKLAAQTLVLSANIYILADRLHIEGLKMLASELYEMNSANGWDRAEFTASLKIIFENTQQNDMLLRAVAIKLIKRNLEALMQKKEFDQFCANNSDIGYEILKSDYLRKLQSKPKTCPYAEIDGFHVLRTTPEYQCLGCKKYT